MNGGVKSALLVSGVALAGCTTANPVEVRAIANPSAALSSGDALAVARGQFALGNVGLALEGFRKAQRENPNDPFVISGIGDCYAAMGRYDIAESSYEVALSLAPRDHVLLLGLASVLERGGQAKRAADIRAEAARFEQLKALMAAQARARALAAAKAPEPSVASASASVTVKLPPARPVKQADVRTARKPGPAVSVAAESADTPQPPRRVASADQMRVQVSPAPVALIEPRLPAPAYSAPAKVDLAGWAPRISAPALRAEAVIDPMVSEPPVPAKPPAVLAAIEPAVDEARVPAPVLLPAAVHLPASEARASIPVMAIDNRLAPTMATSLPPAAPPPRLQPSPPPVALRVKLAEPASPRLERLNRGEVALLTTGNASWVRPAPIRQVVRSPTPERTIGTQVASADVIRWVPLPMSRARPGVQVLNAARSQGLAASARTVLVGRGWRAVGIGNAVAIRKTSVVFYPANRASLGRRLARQFGVQAKMADHDNVVLVLGQDSVNRVAASRRS